MARKKDPNENEEDQTTNDDGKSLAANFFQILQYRNISLNPSEVEEDDDDDDDNDDDENEEGSKLDTPNLDPDEEDDEDEDINIPQSAINVLRGN